MKGVAHGSQTRGKQEADSFKTVTSPQIGDPQVFGPRR